MQVDKDYFVEILVKHNFVTFFSLLGERKEVALEKRSEW